MAQPTASPPHVGQRLRVGAIGLAAVVLLILLAGALARSVGHDRAATAGANTDSAVNLALANDAAGTEPLADMGVSPTAENQTSAR